MGAELRPRNSYTAPTGSPRRSPRKWPILCIYNIRCALYGGSALKNHSRRGVIIRKAELIASSCGCSEQTEGKIEKPLAQQLATKGIFTRIADKVCAL
jgi:hypothetical protein